MIDIRSVSAPPQEDYEWLQIGTWLENFEAVAVKEFKRLNLPVTEIDPESLHEWLPSKLSPELLDDPIIPRPRYLFPLRREWVANQLRQIQGNPEGNFDSFMIVYAAHTRLPGCWVSFFSNEYRVFDVSLLLRLVSYCAGDTHFRQRQREVAKTKYKQRKQICIRHAASIWGGNPGSTYAEIIAECQVALRWDDCQPVTSATIKKWLKAADKDGELTIPKSVMKGGRRRQSTESTYPFDLKNCPRPGR